jgi:CRP/FNR family transcriptional regulator, cyclic AMP receptor protein
MTRRMPSLDPTCNLLCEDPELARAISPGQRTAAEETCTVRALNLRRGRWSQPPGEFLDGAALLVLGGLLLRRVSVEGRASAELLGPGDVVRPSQDRADANLRRATAWRALQATRLALLDDAAVERLAPYPEVMRRLLERSLERSRRLAVNMAIVHHPRVEARLQILFWHLADRWGHARDGRIFLPLRLTHTVIADLIAAQRPTVSTALSDLASRGIVCRAPDGWLLIGPPPDKQLRSPELPTDVPSRRSRQRARDTDRRAAETHRRTRPTRVRRAERDVSTRPG